MFAMCLLIFVVYAELIEVKILDIYVQSNFFMFNQFPLYIRAAHKFPANYIEKSFFVETNLKIK